MNRRNFIKGSAMGGLIFADAVASTAVLARENFPEQEDDSARKFFFNKEGKFKILQLTDTHYVAGDPKSVRALDNVNQMLDLEKPIWLFIPEMWFLGNQQRSPYVKSWLLFLYVKFLLPSHLAIMTRNLTGRGRRCWYCQVYTL